MLKRHLVSLLSPVLLVSTLHVQAQSEPTLDASVRFGLTPETTSLPLRVQIDLKSIDHPGTNYSFDWGQAHVQSIPHGKYTASAHFPSASGKAATIPVLPARFTVKPGDEKELDLNYHPAH